MSSLVASPAWQALEAHRAAWQGRHLRDIFANDPGRFPRLTVTLDALIFDFSKHLIDDDTIALLCALARHRGLEARRDALFGGERINLTEGRAALHIALRNRSDSPVLLESRDVMPGVRAVLERMRIFCHEVRSGAWRGYTGRPIRDIVNIGIGGSDLGPAMAAIALKPFATDRLRAHFVSNVDGAHLADTVANLDPATTLFVIASKTFTTQETLANARSARAWFLKTANDDRHVAKHFVAVSTAKAEVAQFGIDPANMFGFWDWVGGRYSLWSAIGLPVALYVGFDRFEQLLDGAHAVDRHFATAPMERNIPILMALLGIWYTNFWGAPGHAVLPYDQSLARLPAYLQQLEMESNGKRVTRGGEPVDYATCDVLFGEPGTNGQHAFYQLIHQGTSMIPCDFLAAARSPHPIGDHHAMLLSNVLAQAEALMRGKTQAEARAELAASGLPESEIDRLAPHKVFPGDRPSTTIMYPSLDPRTLGMLLAIYEHKTFTQGMIWDINPFDQWGVELGKQLAKPILAELKGGAPQAHDSSTAGLLAWLKARG